MTFQFGAAEASKPFSLAQEPLKLMDETFDFMDQSGDESQQEEQEQEQEVDEVSNVLLKRFDEAPIPRGGVETWRKTSRILRFKLNPNGIDGVGFISQDPHSNKKIKVYPEETKIYTTEIPTFDDDELYCDYVSNLYGIYDALGDEKYYSVPTAGLIQRDAQRQQIEVLNNAMKLTSDELELYIDRKTERGDPEETTFELDEALCIINCLRAIFFAEEYEVPTLLATWINKADPRPDKDFADSVMNSEKPYTHPLFWKYIKQLTLRGLHANAAHALTNSKFDELRSTDVTLYTLFMDSINLLSSYPTSSSPEIFKQWKNTASTAASNASIRNPSNPELTKEVKTLLTLISGNKNVIVEQADTWYEALVGLMIYHIPSTELLQEYYELAISKHQPDHTSIWELACVDIFEGKFLQTLRAISSFSTATAAYVGALCEARGLLKGYTFEDDSKLTNQALLLQQDLFSTTNPSEFLIHTHAMDCLTVEKLVPVGIGLLASSRNPTARSVIAEYLPSYNFKTSDDIEWALTICASLKLPQIAHVIYRIAAQRSLSNGLLLEALLLFARAGEVEFVKHHSWLIFENSLLQGGPIDNVVINSVVDESIMIEGVDPETLKLTPLVRQTLAPYAVLYRFWKHKEEGSLRLALTKLISLLKFPHLPPRLFGILAAQLLLFITVPIPPRVLLKKDLLPVIKVLDTFEKGVMQPTTKKATKLRTESEELYKLLAEDKESHWVKELNACSVSAPKDLKALIKSLRRKLAVKIGAAFLEENYQ